MMSIDHGVYARDELVPLTTLYKAKSGTGSLWGRLTDSIRVFLFPKIEGFKRARISFMNKSEVKFTTLCEMDEDEDGWNGIVGIGHMRIKKNPLNKNIESWGLYFSHLSSGKAKVKLNIYRYEFDGGIKDVKAKSLEDAKTYVFEIGEIPHKIFQIPENYIKWLSNDSQLVG